jgi:hypothetical protein
VNLDDASALLRAAAGWGITTLAAVLDVRSDYPGIHVDELGRQFAALQTEVSVFESEWSSSAALRSPWLGNRGERQLWPARQGPVDRSPDTSVADNFCPVAIARSA